MRTFARLFVSLVLAVIFAGTALAQVDSLGLPPVEPGGPASQVYELLLMFGSSVLVAAATWLVTKFGPMIPGWAVILVVAALTAIYELILPLFSGSTSILQAVAAGCGAIVLNQIIKQLSKAKDDHNEIRAAKQFRVAK